MVVVSGHTGQTYNLDDDVELDFEADLRAQDAWRESQLMQETGGLGSMARGILRPGGRHTIVCKHWLRDLCMKGDKCDFLHQYDLARMPECVQWSRFGKCPDNDCDFRHDTEKMECQKYKFGFCKLGSQCRMRHDKLSRTYLPETIPDWYLKEIIPNIFDFVPKLPEEAVRATVSSEEPLPHQAHAQVPFGVMQQAPPVDAWSVAAPASNAWAAPQAAWSAPSSQPRQSPQPSIDLTEERPHRRGPLSTEQRRRDERPAEKEPGTRREDRAAPRRDERPRDGRREEKREERPRDDRRDERRDDRRDERRRDDLRDDKRGEWRDRHDQGRGADRRRSRSYERRREDRSDRGRRR